MDKAAHQTSKLSFKPLSPPGQTSVGQETTPTLSLSSVDISTSACSSGTFSMWVLCRVFLDPTFLFSVSF